MPVELKDRRLAMVALSHDEIETVQRALACMVWASIDRPNCQAVRQRVRRLEAKLDSAQQALAGDRA